MPKLPMVWRGCEWRLQRLCEVKARYCPHAATPRRICDKTTHRHRARSGCIAGNAPARGHGCAWCGPAPVSYTHLDVYKRQTLDTPMKRFDLMQQVNSCLLYTSRCV